MNNDGKRNNNNVPSLNDNVELELEIENLEFDGEGTITSSTGGSNDDSKETNAPSSGSNETSDLKDVSDDEALDSSDTSASTNSSDDAKDSNDSENIDGDDLPENYEETPSDIDKSDSEEGDNLPSEGNNDDQTPHNEADQTKSDDSSESASGKEEQTGVSKDETDGSDKSDSPKDDDKSVGSDGKDDIKRDNEGLDKKEGNSPSNKENGASSEKKDGDSPTKDGDKSQGDKASKSSDNLPQTGEKSQKPEIPKEPSKPSGSNGGSFKDRLKNGAKNAAERAKQRAGNAARDKVNNSKPMQAYNKARNAAQKAKNTADKAKKGLNAAKKTAKVAVKAAKGAAKAVKGFIDLMISLSPWSWLVLLVVVLLVILICAIATIAGKDDVNSSSEKENYSEVDTKTLDKLKGYYERYPNADAALSMVTVIYPYYESLIDPSISDSLNLDESTLENFQDTIESDDGDDDDSGDEEDCKDDECEEETQDDMYLTLYRKISYRWKFRKLLRKSNSMTVEEFEEYIVNKWMEQEKGYKNLLSNVKGEEKETLKKEILEDLKSQKEYFKNYIYDNVACSSSSQSISYSDAGGILEGEGVVILKDTLSTNFETLKKAKTLYGTENLNMTIKRYVMGVAYNEISSELKNEAVAKSVMVASQSFLLGRTSPGSADGVGMGYKTEKKDGKTIFYMRANSYDQGFCDVYEGCDKNAGIYSHANVEGTPNSSGLILPKEVNVNGYPKLDAKSLSNLEKWYDEIAGEFIYDDKTKGFAGNQFDTWGSYCPQGRCLAHQETIKLAHNGRDYKNILYGSMYSDSRYAAYNMETKMLSSVSSECTPISSDGACGIPDNNYIYYSQRDYASTQFCGRSGASIASSGCGVTSMAMVISNLTDTKVTPPDTMKEAYSGGFCGAGIDGTSAGYFPVAAGNHGLTYKSIAVSAKGVQDALSALKAGGLIIANVGSASPFTSGGHYIVIRKVDANNKVYVGDPNHKELYTTPYDINDFINKGWITHGWWSFTSNKSESIVKEYCTTAVGDGVSTGSMSSPVKGEKPYCGNYPSYPGHTGIDMSVPVGTPIYATDGGTVSVSKDLTGCDGRCCVGGYYSYGRYIEIKHSNGLSTLYAHLSSRDVKEGDKVSKGQLIGKSGANGNTRSGNGCNGPHLHFEVKQNGSPINPCTYMK